MKSTDPFVQQIQLHLPFKFADPESKALAMQAIMHSSASHETNNVALARVGEFAAKAAALEHLFLSSKRATGAEYNNVLSNKFSTDSLSSVGRRLELDKILICGGGTTHVSDNMVAQSLNALFAAVKLSGGQPALEKVLLSLEII